MDGLKAEIDAMGKQLAEEQGNISVYTDRQTKVIFSPSTSCNLASPVIAYSYFHSDALLTPSFRQLPPRSRQRLS